MTIDLNTKKSTRTHLDQATDDPKQARSEIAGNWRKYDDVLDAMGTIAQMDIDANGGLENNGSDELRASVPVSGKTANYTITTTDRSKLMGALGTVVTAFVDVPEEVIAGVTATVVAFFVWLVPNKVTT